MFQIPPAEEKARAKGAFRRIKGNKALYSVLILALCFLLMLGTLVAVASPEQHDIRVGEPAPETIKATKDIEDKIATERLREQAASSLGEGLSLIHI